MDLNAYNAHLKALGSGVGNDFEAIPLGGTVKLQTPQAAYCFGMEGADSHAIASPPAPTFSSAQTAGEKVEDYWAALSRNVPFGQYGSDPTINQAVADLNKLSDYRGPKVKGQVTSDVIFRGPTPGDSNGQVPLAVSMEAGALRRGDIHPDLPHFGRQRRLHD